jgi:hypothetical protein
VAERDLEIEVMKEIAERLVSVPARREHVAYAVHRKLLQRRSYTLLGVARSALGHRWAKAVEDAPVLPRMAALAAQRKGHAMSWGRCFRLSRRATLQAPRRRPRKRHLPAAGHGPGRRPAPTRSGRMTSCSTGAPMASSSSA